MKDNANKLVKLEIEKQKRGLKKTLGSLKGNPGFMEMMNDFAGRDNKGRSGEELLNGLIARIDRT